MPLLSFNVEVQWWSRRIVHFGWGLEAMSLPPLRSHYIVLGSIDSCMLLLGRTA